MSALINNYTDFPYFRKNVKDKSVRNIYKKSYRATGFRNKKYLQKYNKTLMKDKERIREINEQKKAKLIGDARKCKAFNIEQSVIQIEEENEDFNFIYWDDWDDWDEWD